MVCHGFYWFGWQEQPFCSYTAKLLHYRSIVSDYITDRSTTARNNPTRCPNLPHGWGNFGRLTSCDVHASATFAFKDNSNVKWWLLRTHITQTVAIFGISQDLIISKLLGTKEKVSEPYSPSPTFQTNGGQGWRPSPSNIPGWKEN